MLRTKSTICCIIPFFNEDVRLLTLLSQLNALRFIQEIICIDDGSTNGLAQQISTSFPNVKIITSRKNVGKSGAVSQAVGAITSDYVFLCDADLLLSDPQELAHAWEKLSNTQTVDMVIFRQRNDLFIWKLLRFDLFLSGERFVKTEVLQTVCQLQPQHYELEMALNEYCWRKSLPVRWMPLSSSNQQKLAKWPFLIAVPKIMQGIIAYSTSRFFRNYYSLWRFFCRQSLL